MRGRAACWKRRGGEGNDAGSVSFGGPRERGEESGVLGGSYVCFLRFLSSSVILSGRRIYNDTVVVVVVVVAAVVGIGDDAGMGQEQGQRMIGSEAGERREGNSTRGSKGRREVVSTCVAIRDGIVGNSSASTIRIPTRLVGIFLVFSRSETRVVVVIVRIVVIEEQNLLPLLVPHGLVDVIGRSVHRIEDSTKKGSTGRIIVLAYPVGDLVVATSRVRADIIVVPVRAADIVAN